MDDVKILIVDNDSNIRKTIKSSVEAAGYFADEAGDGITALKLFKRNKYNIVILETDIPELDSWNVCRQIRKMSDVPIIIISSHSYEERKLSFFNLEVDDYVVKPFFVSELLARINVFLRRTHAIKALPNTMILLDGISIDTISRVVYIDDKPIQLAPKEYELLLFFAKNPNKAFSREALLNQVWGDDFFGTDRTVDTHIKTLREHIKPYHHRIVTVWGFGYKFEI